MLHATVEFDKPGKQTGFIEVPHSVHDDAWGVIPVPVAVISNGLGPTVILEGGNHGDEYEGPIVLGELIRTLDPRAVSGRLIFIPAINLPAVAAARRTSPIDDLNFNRAFPGDPLGSPWLMHSSICIREVRRS
jgi:N2-acetyl-L-2,4-diaminobutanoate deacetylase